MEYFGWISSVSFAVCGIPQAYLCFTQKHSNGVSNLFLLLWILGEVSGIVYAASLNSFPLLFNYIFSLLCAMVILYYKVNPCLQEKC
jgi:hypothetical protein